jgi:anti-sigma B factor antagonist
MVGPWKTVSYGREAVGVFEVQAEPVRDGTVVVRVAGEVDLTVSPQLERVLLAAPAMPDAHRVVVDLERLQFLDSSGVHALVKGYLATRDAGLPYEVRNASGMVARVLHITGVAEAFGMAADTDGYPKGA